METEVQVPLRFRVMSVLRLAIAFVVRIVFKLYYGTGKTLPPITDDILKQPAIEVARKIRHGQVSSVEVLETCIKRIRDVNPILNCFVEDRFDLALQEAREADQLIKSGSQTIEQLEKEKPFLGVPFTTKDCIAVQGLHHTAGVTLRKDVIAKEDADSIQLLRKKGAIIIGITNVPELCMWWETHNQIHGRTNNPYDTTRIVGGSSGGEGCIQAAAGSIFGVGSDIGGSIRMPAYFNGIFGHKPSKNIVSNKGQYPIPETEFHNSFLGLGPMTRFAADLKPLLDIMAGERSAQLNLDKPVNVTSLKVYYQFSNRAPLIDPVDRDIVEAIKRVVQVLESKYKTKTEEKNMTILKKSAPIWMTTMKNEKKFGEFILEKSTIPKILYEMAKNIFGLSGNTFIGLVTSLLDYTGAKIGSKEYTRYLGERDKLEKTFTDMLGDDGVFLYPTHPTPAPYHNEPLFKAMNFSYTSIINCLGLPATTVPLGLGREGLPIGLQVVANHNNDRLCFAIAEVLEKEFGGWVEPSKQ